MATTRCKRSTRTRMSGYVWLGVASALFLASPAEAQVTDDDAACRKAINAHIGKYVNTAAKAIAACHKKRNKGALPDSTDCNDSVTADSKGKLTALAALFHAQMIEPGGVCSPGGVASAAVLATFPSCKSPASSADDGGATSGIDDFGEVADCQTELSRKLAEQVARATLGQPAPSVLTKDSIKCHSSIAKRVRGVLYAYIKERGRCQLAADSVGGSYDYTCEGQDPKTKIAKAVAKLQADVEKRCSGLDTAALAAIDSCDDTLGGLVDCAGAGVGSKTGAGLASMAYGLSICPRGIKVTSQRLGHFEDQDIDYGKWGILHDVEPPKGSEINLRLDCDASCGNCAVSLDGTVFSPPRNCRCTNDATISCNVINGPAAACGGSQCECYFFAPQPVNGGLPYCLLHELDSDITGTVDAGTGASDLQVTLRAKFYLGESNSAPCPRCVGDVVLEDGVREGTCDAGARVGLPCDASGETTAFGTTSYECPPNPLAIGFPSGTPLVLDRLTDDPQVMLRDSCPQFAPADSCEPTNTCVAVSIDKGRCAFGPDYKYCDGIVSAAGRGQISCADNSDCSGLVPEYGSCTIVRRNECFLDEIITRGSRRGGVALSPFYATLAAPFCIPEGPWAGDGAWGFPGPGRTAYAVRYEPRCGRCDEALSQCQVDSDCGGPSDVCLTTNNSWNPPTGSLCPE